jgi:hypothetical protein
MKIRPVYVGRLQLADEGDDVAWVVTSSAVVGSSATTSAGALENAMAMSTRWHMPPDSWKG